MSPDGEWLFYTVGGLTAETGRLFAYHRGDITAYEVPVTLSTVSTTAWQPTDTAERLGCGVGQAIGFPDTEE